MANSEYIDPADYQRTVNEMPLYDDVVYGLTGELGEVVELVKKDMRKGDRRKPVDVERLTDEMGDVLWYFTRLASKYGITLDEIMTYNIKKLTARHAV